MTPCELYSVTYSDVDQAVKSILVLYHEGLKEAKRKGEDEGSVIVYLSKSDLKSAFHLLPLKANSWPWLVFKASDPASGKTYYFVDKCLPFGASISCSHFQRVSDTLKHIFQFRTKAPTANYLDDFLFIALSIILANQRVEFSQAMSRVRYHGSSG